MNGEETLPLSTDLVTPVVKGVQETAKDIEELGLDSDAADEALKKQFAHGLEDAAEIQKQLNEAAKKK